MTKLLKYVSGKRLTYDPEIKIIQDEVIKRIKPVYQEFPDEREEYQLVITIDASDYASGHKSLSSPGVNGTTQALLDTEASICCVPLAPCSDQCHAYRRCSSGPKRLPEDGGVTIPRTT